MNKFLQIAAALGVGVLLSTGCVAYGPGPDGYYDYDYYPDANFYYYPVGGYYYWYDGAHWQRGRHLPSGYAIHSEQRQQVRLHTTRPWTENRAPTGGGHGWSGEHH